MLLGAAGNFAGRGAAQMASRVPRPEGAESEIAAWRATSQRLDTQPAGGTSMNRSRQ
jgi:hypothetical protein